MEYTGPSSLNIGTDKQREAFKKLAEQYGDLCNLCGERGHWANECDTVHKLREMEKNKAFHQYNPSCHRPHQMRGSPSTTSPTCHPHHQLQRSLGTKVRPRGTLILPQGTLIPPQGTLMQRGVQGGLTMRASPEGLRKGALNIRRAGATCLER